MCSQFLSALSGILFRQPVQPLVFLTASSKRKHKKLAFIVLADSEVAAALMSKGAGAALAGSKNLQKHLKSSKRSWTRTQLVRRQGDVVCERVDRVPCYFLRLLQLCSLCCFSPNTGSLNQDTAVFSARLISGWSVKQQGTGSHIASGSHWVIECAVLL